MRKGDIILGNQATGKIRAKQLVAEAIKETGKADIWPVARWIEDKFLEDLKRWSKRSHPCYGSIFVRMEKLGICTSKDFDKLIKEVVVS